ncbi:MAG: hypothetical protein LUI13_12935 [Lachnospiraceae bacterium]|nr:hypothetical protein [Lachnospiraceae bacterium]
MLLKSYGASGVIRTAPLEDTSIADYVWLPFRFDGEMAYLAWKDEWGISEYE